MFLLEFLLCGLYDVQKSQFKIYNQWKIVVHCQIIPFTIKVWVKEGDKELVKQKNSLIFVVDGKDSNKKDCL
jgi:hypothetical protein